MTLAAEHSRGPVKTLAAILDDARREEFRRDMVAWHETFKSELGYDQPCQHAITRATRGWAG